jgi:hypothetical protein
MDIGPLTLRPADAGQLDDKALSGFRGARDAAGISGRRHRDLQPKSLHFLLDPLRNLFDRAVDDLFVGFNLDLDKVIAELEGTSRDSH